MSSEPRLNDGETLRQYFAAVTEFYQKRPTTLPDELARRHEDRGQVDHAIEYWSMFRGQKNHLIDSLRVQAMLKSPYRESTKKNMPKRWFDPMPHTHLALEDAIGQGALFCNMLIEHTAKKD